YGYFVSRGDNRLRKVELGHLFKVADIPPFVVGMRREAEGELIEIIKYAYRQVSGFEGKPEHEIIEISYAVSVVGLEVELNLGPPVLTRDNFSRFFLCSSFDAISAIGNGRYSKCSYFCLVKGEVEGTGSQGLGHHLGLVVNGKSRSGIFFVIENDRFTVKYPFPIPFSSGRKDVVFRVFVNHRAV